MSIFISSRADTFSFVVAMAPQTENINLLAAIRCGEIHPPMLARTIATLDHMLEVDSHKYNIFRFARRDLSLEARYARSREVIKILKQAFDDEKIDFKGEHYELELKLQINQALSKRWALLYFGGYFQRQKNFVLSSAMSI